MTKIFLGLGSNLGNKEANIAKAIELLKEKIVNVHSAPLYNSKAWGITDQPDFINTAVVGETELQPEDLLTFVKDVENRVGRVESFRWGPREIDIDILFYGEEVYSFEQLQIPHIGVAERDTVLVPMLDLDPDFIHPISKKNIQQLLDELPIKKRSII